MILFVLIAFLHLNRSTIKNGLNLLPKKQALSLLPPQWYYIYINSYKDINAIKSSLPNLKISPLELNEGYLTLFLTPNEARLLNELPSIEVYTKAPKRTTFSSPSQKNESYIVYAHSTFAAPRYSQIISNFGPYYFISTNQPTIIENDPTVLSIKKVPLFHTMNRWTTGFVQSGESDFTIKNGYYASNRKYNERGLNGSNVIVTLIDTGTEVDNCLFKDANYPTPFNETNLNHRKIVRYDPFVDKYDKFFGHGTHCAGTIAGSVDSLPMSLYNGHAPGAKLYVADIGSDETKKIDISYTFDILKQAKELNSPIISCSWGSDITDYEFTYIFDSLCYENPSQLFVFAAGNDYYNFKIGTPENSKNVLTIASSTPPRSYYLNFRYSNIVKLVDGNESFRVYSNNVFASMNKYDVSYLSNIELINFNDLADGNEYSNKAVIIDSYNRTDDNVTQVLNFLSKKNAKAAIVLGNFYIEHDKIIVLNVKSFDNTSFLNNHHIVNITIEINDLVNNPVVAKYSSKGPTTHGNRKPDIMAPGTSILSAYSKANSNECNADSSLIEMTGTSMATPAVSGSLALIYQYLNESIHGLPKDNTKEITSALLRAFAIAGSGDTANVNEGYGNLNLSRVLIYPNLDFGQGLRFRSDKINHNKLISFFIKTDHVGKLTASLSWIDIPSKLLSPLFSFFEFYIIGPDGNIYEEIEQYSTNKKIVINNAIIGTYEIRLRMNQMYQTDDAIDYSIVVVGPFDQLDFNSNPSELKINYPKSCSSKCPVNKGYAKCNEELSLCICDKYHTGTNCEFEIFDVQENQTLEQQISSRNFLYTYINLSNYKSMDKSHLKKYSLTINVGNKNPSYNIGMMRSFFNDDNNKPLYIPNFLVSYFSSSLSLMLYLSSMVEYNDLYLTVFNDYNDNITAIVNWYVNETDFDDFEDQSEKFTNTNTFKILMLTLIIVGGVAIVSILVIFTVKMVNKKKKKQTINNYQQYTDAGPNSQLNIKLIDDA